MPPLNRRAFLLAAGVVSCATRAAAHDADTVIFAQSTPIGSLDPARLNPAEAEAALCLYDRLLEFDDRMAVVPGLATGFDLAADLKSLTLTLRPKLTFHDGTPLDAAAVRSNLERMRDGARNKLDRPLWDVVSRVETPDPLTVVIRAAKPCPQLPSMLAGIGASIAGPSAGVEEAATGSGPYMLDVLSPGGELILRPFDRYWGGKPAVRRLIFRHIPDEPVRLHALHTGAVDIADAVSPAQGQTVAHDPLLTPVARSGLRAMGFMLNLTRPPLTDPRVRQALNLAVSVSAIVQKVFLGYAEALDSPLAPNAAGHVTAGRSPFDAGRGRGLLEAGGWKAGADGIRVRDGVRLQFTVLSPEGLYPADMAVTEAACAALRVLGVDTRIVPIAGAAYTDRLRQDTSWDLALFGFDPPAGSGLYQLQALFGSAAGTGSWNLGRYRNPAVDAALDRAATAPAAPARNVALADAQRLIWQDAPWIWLHVADHLSALRKPVTGVDVLPLGYTSLRRASS